jgi:hypothetical protein
MFYEGDVTKDYSTPTEVLRDIYRDYNIKPTTNIKGWEQTSAFVIKTNTSEEPNWLPLNAVIPCDYRKGAKAKTKTSKKAATKKKEEAVSSKKRKLVVILISIVFSSVFLNLIRRIPMHSILQKRKREQRRWSNIARNWTNISFRFLNPPEKH